MSNSLIDLNALSTYKDYSDLKYQDKLTAGTGISISNNVISATGGGSYTAGDGISINNGVISATPSFENGHSVYISGGDNKVLAGTTGTICTATRNCRFYFSIQVQGTDSTARTTKVFLNNVEIYSQYDAPSRRYTRIIHGAVILSAGDVVTVQNPYSFDFEVPSTIFYE